MKRIYENITYLCKDNLRIDILASRVFFKYKYLGVTHIIILYTRKTYYIY